VGIDVQAVDGSVPALDIARGAFCAEESAALAACPPGERPSRFCELWTLKEALLKAIGTGLGWPTSCASFDVGARRAVTRHLPPFAPARWAVLLADVGGSHKLAIAIGDAAAGVSVTQTRDFGGGVSF
jgi:4'-phosphopantetheinyl transferase